MEIRKDNLDGMLKTIGDVAVKDLKDGQHALVVHINNFYDIDPVDLAEEVNRFNKNMMNMYAEHIRKRCEDCGDENLAMLIATLKMISLAFSMVMTAMVNMAEMTDIIEDDILGFIADEIMDSAKEEGSE